MKRLRILCIVLIALIALILPGTVFAQSAPDRDPGPAWNIKIEFRYTKGEESKLNIPNSIARYGRAYHLVSVSDPVLEKTLPATRTYTWFIDGTISQDELHLLQGLEGYELTETEVEIGRVIDKTHVMEGLATNDVEALPATRSYPEGTFSRAAVRFDIEGYDDFDLPLSYEAEIIYRGIEIYKGPGYEVTATYTTVEDLKGVPQYVVVATYAPDDLVLPAAATGGTGEGDGNILAPLVPPIDNEPEGQPDYGAGSVIDDDLVPQGAGAGSESEGINPWLIATIIIAAVLGGFLIWMLLTRRRNVKEKQALREERRKEALRAQGLAEYD